MSEAAESWRRLKFNFRMVVTLMVLDWAAKSLGKMGADKAGMLAMAAVVATDGIEERAQHD